MFMRPFVAGRASLMCKVAIVDDHDFVRTGIGAILQRSRKWGVCAMGRSEQDALKIVETQQPNILILDLFLGYRDGLALIKDLVGRYPKTAIIAISEYWDASYARRAMKAGAHGFLMKSATAEHLLAAVECIHNGDSYQTRWCALAVSGKPVSRDPAENGALDLLTDRELHVFQLIGVGLGTGEIARELGLSRKTIECYDENLKQKLGCGNAALLKERANDWMKGVQRLPPRLANRGRSPILTRSRIDHSGKPRTA